jgi:NADH:ubiquinone oxidoreductase subunit 2 (subunit N)
MKERGNYFLITQIEKFYTFFILLRIAGIPPFLGFFIKISILFILLLFKKFFLTLFLVVSSIFLIFIYRRIFLNRLRINLPTNKLFSPYKNYNIFFFRIIFLIGPIIFFIF